MLKNITTVSLLLFSSTLYAETLDEAIKRFVPTATETIADVAPTEEILIQARSAVQAAQLVDPENEEIKKIARLLETIVAGVALSQEEREELISQIAAFATANSAVYSSTEKHQQINNAIQASIAALLTKMELMAFPTEISSGGYSNLMWVSTQNNCQLAGVTVAAAGTMRVGPLNSDTQFSLICSNEQGQSSQKSVKIKVVAPKPAVAERPASPEKPRKEPRPQQAPQNKNYPTGVLKIVSASASGYQKLSNGEGYTPAKAIDGDLSQSSRWSKEGLSSKAADSEWITLDLGEERKLNTLRIAFYKYDQGRIYDYDIAVSKDNKTWKTVVKNSKSAKTRWTTESFNTELGQYVRLTINSASDNTRWANLYEIEVLNREQKTTPKKVTLKWAASQGEVEGYNVYYGTSKDNTEKMRLKVLKTNSRGFNKSAPSVTFNSETDLGLIESGRACFSLKAFNSAGESGMSKPVCGDL
ncbi:MAG TPA: hypothetical protein ENJ07_01035 [Gammaproteobacteria bacterium]|nr:hypothetical protein [Gammaproteobacteria bacterium]